MNDLICKIEEWANDRNIIQGCKPIDQAMKLFSEFGELADAVGKGQHELIKDGIGDVFVVLTIMAKQLGLNINDTLGFSGISVGSLKHGVVHLIGCLEYFVSHGGFDSLIECVEALDAVCCEARVKLEECVQLAYDDIKDRKGIMHNGVFVKSTDPVYAEILEKIQG